MPDLRDIVAAEPAEREPRQVAREAPRRRGRRQRREGSPVSRRYLADLASRRAYEDALDTGEDRDVGLSHEDPFTDRHGDDDHGDRHVAGAHAGSETAEDDAL